VPTPPPMLRLNNLHISYQNTLNKTIFIEGDCLPGSDVMYFVSTLKKEVPSFSKTFVYQTTWLHISDYSDAHTYRCEKLNSLFCAIN
jgi:hypothetical protein